MSRYIYIQSIARNTTARLKSNKRQQKTVACAMAGTESSSVTGIGMDLKVHLGVETGLNEVTGTGAGLVTGPSPETIETGAGTGAVGGPRPCSGTVTRTVESSVTGEVYLTGSGTVTGVRIAVQTRTGTDAPSGTETCLEIGAGSETGAGKGHEAEAGFVIEAGFVTEAGFIAVVKAGSGA